MILDANIYKMRCRVGNDIKPPLLIHARTMEQADSEALLYWADLPENAGQEVAVLSATEVSVESL